MALTPHLLHALRQCRLALGGAPLGNLFRAVAENAAVDVVRRACAAGIRYFDTAPHYGHGLSERRFGVALRHVPRGSFVLSTKVGRLLHPAADATSTQHGYVAVLPFVQSFDYTRDGILGSLDESRRRLGIDRHCRRCCPNACSGT